MKKLKMRSKNLVDENIEYIAKRFPNCVTEGKVDFDLLRQELSSSLVEGKDERYRLDWSGKRQAILTANSPIAKTLRPVREESVNFDTTENLYIEGDNLDVLKLLHETYLGKVKMIYIDPPYNTGNDFVYNDDFAENTEEYLERSNQKDDQGNRLETNKETNGRFHSDWLSMMYMRLKLAKDLLTDDGVIFISIDDNEQANLKRVCDEIFGEDNFIGVAQRKTRGSATTKGEAELQTLSDYILVYCRNKQDTKLNKKKVGEKTYPYHDERGDYYIVPLQDNGPHGTREARPNLWYPIYLQKNGELSYVKNEDTVSGEYLPALHQRKDGRWMWSKQKFDKDSKDLTIYNQKVWIKHYYKEEEDQNRYQYEKLWLEDFQNAKGTKSVNDLFEEKGLFDNPKPIELLEWCLGIGANDDSIILDFFSGSATTAHAIMQLNTKDGGKRKFIMVQLPEQTDENSEAYKAGYKSICEIGKERIRRAGKKIADDNKSATSNLDIGFRVLRLADSNMHDVFYNPKQYDQLMLSSLYSLIKEGRTDEDILFQIMLEKGILLSSKIEKRITTNGKQTYYIVGDTDLGNIDLVCCLDKKIDTEAVKEIAKLNAECVVFLDSGIEDDATLTNIKQIFDTYSKKTKVEVL